MKKDNTAIKHIRVITEFERKYSMENESLDLTTLYYVVATQADKPAEYEIITDTLLEELTKANKRINALLTHISKLGKKYMALKNKNTKRRK